MIPTKAVNDSVKGLVAADVAYLAAVTATHVHLIMAAFTPNIDTDFTALTEANFDGYAALAASAGGAQQSFTDPINGQQVVQVKEPAGGWHWQTTGATNLPQTIYGWVLTDTADAVTIGSELFPFPIPLVGIGQNVDIPQVRFRLPPLVMS